MIDPNLKNEISLNQLFAVTLMYRIRIKEDLYESDLELLNDIDLAMYCYGNHLAMNYEQIKDI